MSRIFQRAVNLLRLSQQETDSNLLTFDAGQQQSGQQQSGQQQSGQQQSGQQQSGQQQSGQQQSGQQQQQSGQQQSGQQQQEGQPQPSQNGNPSQSGAGDNRGGQQQGQQQSNMQQEGQQQSKPKPGQEGIKPSGDPHPGARAKLANFVSAALSGRPVEGAERELQLELGLANVPFLCVPWSLLELATSLPDDSGQQNTTVIQRLFADSVAARLGVSLPTVAAGTAEYLPIISGTTPQMTAQGAAVAGQADAGFSPEKLSPKRLTAQYTLRIEDLAVLPALEDAIREDLRGAFVEQMNNRILNGQLSADGTTNPEDVRGIFTAMLPAAPTEAKPTDPTLGDVAAFIGGGVDGRRARSLAEVTALLAPQGYGQMAGLVNANQDPTERYAANLVVSDLVPDFVYQAKSGVGKNDGLSKYALRAKSAGTPAVAPVWEGFILIRDEVTAAAKGEVVLTAHMLWNFAILDSAAYAVGLPYSIQDRT